MNLIFVGPQGSGKGTQAKRITERLGLCHISSGDALREVAGGRLQVAGGLAEEVRKVMSEGSLVPDELVVKILKERLGGADCKKGFILDGFPRNLNQVKELRKIVEIDRVIEIVIGDDESLRRISGRRGCSKCGAIYNVNTSPKPKVEGICDKCGVELSVRRDDSEKALRERLKIYHEETENIFRTYPFMRIDGEKSIEEVEKDIVEGIGRKF